MKQIPPPNMSLEEIYQDKLPIIRKAYQMLADNIDNDKDYDLSTDELYELTTELFEKYLTEGESDNW